MITHIKNGKKGVVQSSSWLDGAKDMLAILQSVGGCIF